jgi:hypothetical protein
LGVHKGWWGAFLSVGAGQTSRRGLRGGTAAGRKRYRMWEGTVSGARQCGAGHDGAAGCVVRGPEGPDRSIMAGTEVRDSGRGARMAA